MNFNQKTDFPSPICLPQKRLVAAALVSLLLSFLLTGCAGRTELSSGTVKNSVTTLTAVVTAEDLSAMELMDQLVSVDFSGSDCYEEILEWGERHPAVELRYTVTLPEETVAENSDEELDLTGLKDSDAESARKLLRYLPNLKRVNLGTEKDGLSPQAALSFAETYPEIEFLYSFTLLGKKCDLNETSLDLRSVTGKELRGALDSVACLRRLKTVELGTDERENGPAWKDILALREAVPEAEVDYTFHLCGMEFTLEDEVIDLSYHRVDDDGEAVLGAALCMPGLRTLDMDTCGIGNERMAEIRDALPDVEVIWRVNFGINYTARTDVIRILASSPSYGGRALTNDDMEKIGYCTKLKYLDVGHNESITDLSFVRNLPDLEVLIVAMNPLGDLTPLADCGKLEYLELFYSNTDDLSPLAGVKSLKHLNVGHCPKLKDISPIYDLELERFYLGAFASCPVPEEQVEHYRQLHPDCEVDNTSGESSEGAWRRGAFLTGERLEWYQKQPYYSEERRNYAPRYALLRDQLGYDGLQYSTVWLDPTYRFPGTY